MRSAVRIAPLVAWYDLWAGVFWDAKKRWLYILPVPCLGVIVKFGEEVAPEPDRSAAALAEALAERDLLQDILDSRPAINAALPDSYIRWSQAVYAGDFTRAAMAANGGGNG